ncbi:MAG: amidohydrolase [Candidatus Latescibacteria bacterium]|nr:amidohydrolase [Candidatus Latescibacterota bacterium]
MTNRFMRSWNIYCLFCAVLVIVPSLAFPQVKPAKSPPRTLTPAKQTAVSWVDANQAKLIDVNQAIWNYAEVGLQEYKSSQALIDLLTANGFTIQKGVAGMPTAFVASYGSGKPVIGMMAEYDALPGLSQDTVPYRKPLVENGAGHGCGHSIFGTASTAAAIAIKDAMVKGKLAGTIRLYGTPAEETGIGKVYMVKAGLFDDVDAVLHWHLGDKTAVGYGTTKAVVSVKFTFTGVAAHASASPHQGRSALDAVELMDIGVNYMREHVKEDARIHYVITDGGGQPNVVPPRAQVWYYVRANTHKDVENYYAWIVDIAKAAAQMTKTSVEVKVDSDTHEILPNRPLAELLYSNLTLVGAPRFTDDEKMFARKLQETVEQEFGGKFDRALSEEVEPLPDRPEQGTASTDVGEVSWKVPTIGMRASSTVYGAPGHSWLNVAASGMSIGQKGMVVAAKALACTGIELLTNPKAVEAAWADFRARTKDTTFVSLIPPGQGPPTAIR